MRLSPLRSPCGRARCQRCCQAMGRRLGEMPLAAREPVAALRECQPPVVEVQGWCWDCQLVHRGSTYKPSRPRCTGRPLAGSVLLYLTSSLSYSRIVQGQPEVPLPTQLCSASSSYHAALHVPCRPPTACMSNQAPKPALHRLVPGPPASACCSEARRGFAAGAMAAQHQHSMQNMDTCPGQHTPLTFHGRWSYTGLVEGIAELLRIP